MCILKNCVQILPIHNTLKMTFKWKNMVVVFFFYSSDKVIRWWRRSVFYNLFACVKSLIVHNTLLRELCLTLIRYLYSKMSNLIAIVHT